jgi:citrate synthase
MTGAAPTTALCSHNAEQVFYRDKDLVSDLLGKAGFVEIMISQVLDRRFTPQQLALIDAILVCLMEHGFTPSAISARLTYMSAPEAIQGAMAAGLLNVGSQFLGSMQNCADLLAEILRQGPAHAETVVTEYRAAKRRVPGFGHHLHRPDDPRAIALLDLARTNGVAARHVEALRTLAIEVSRQAGRHVTINATGAIAAILRDLDVPSVAMRGFAIVARAAGLVAHLVEEQSQPTGRFIWDVVDHAIGFAHGPGTR